MKNKRYWFDNENLDFASLEDEDYLNRLQEIVSQNQIKLNRGDTVGFEMGNEVYFDGSKLILIDIIDEHQIFAIPREFTFPEFDLDYFLEFGNDFINLSTNHLKFSEIKKCSANQLLLEMTEDDNLKSLEGDKEIEYVTFVYQNKTYYILNPELSPNFNEDLFSDILRLYLNGYITINDNGFDISLIDQPGTINNLFFYS